MTGVQALWLPGWYNLDDNVEVGVTDEWRFWNDRAAMFENWRKNPDVPTVQLCFFNDLSSSTKRHIRRATVRRITHPVIGDLVKVDTSRFGVYEYVTTDGTRYEVEAEEDPGRCWRPEVDIDEWYVIVELDNLGEPSEA